MRMKLLRISGFAGILICFLVMACNISAQAAQNSIQLFSPIVVRLSDKGTGYGAATEDFNSTTLNLNCPASQITAILSSTPDSNGYLLVDNNLNLTVTAGSTVVGTTDVCLGGVSTSPVGPFQNCFTKTYETEASDGNLTNQDPDNFVATGGVRPIDVSQYLVPGSLKLKIDLQDEGGYLANSSLYLNTNCSQGGVTGPALISGNPISSANPNADQLSQNFSFSSTFGQQIGFQYDLTQAQAAGTLDIVNATIPEVGDQPLDPAIFRSTYVPGTSFSTTSCLIHAGELLPNGQSACKVYTLDCKVGIDATASGAQCPISSLPNELFQDEFDGPAFTLQDIATPNGPTFHEGIGLLMAKEGWTGGPCIFAAAANLTSLDCPQNLLTRFNSAEVTVTQVVRSRRAIPSESALSRSVASDASDVKAAATSNNTASSGSYTGTGRTTHPNSTFISIAGVPEDLTTVSVAGQQPAYWINHSSATVSLSSQPPNLGGVELPGATTFVASPIQSITYGLVEATDLPTPGDLLSSDTVISNNQGCPTPVNPGVPIASTFNAAEQTLSGLSDGKYLLYYFAQDCAGTEELKFAQDQNGYWSTNFYTYPINVDTAAPVVQSGPILSPAPSSAGTYFLGQPVTASYNCTDTLSGVIHCGSQSYTTPILNTGSITSPVDTSSAGTKSFTVVATDAAGNHSSKSVQYQVVGAYDTQIVVAPQSGSVSYPGSTLVKVTVRPTPNSLHHTPKGILQLQDASNAFITLATLAVQGNGTGNGIASFYLSGLSAGSHNLVAKYSGDSYNSAGLSMPVSFSVLPAPVNLTVSCSGGTLVFGTDYTCKVYTTPILAGANTSMSYQYDNSPPVTVTLTGGNASFTIGTPSVGQHILVVSYTAQGNYAAASSKTETFVVHAK